MCKSVGKGCPLATSCKRKKYYKDSFKVVEPIEYALDERGKRTLQYIPVLKFLQQLFTDGHILKGLDTGLISEETKKEGIYSSFRDGLFFKGNSFLSGGELRVFTEFVCG